MWEFGARRRRLTRRTKFYWHDYRFKNYVRTMQYLAELREGGKIKHVGLTNFDTNCMQEMLDGGVKPAMNQVQYSLLDRRPENRMVAWCEANDVPLLPFGVAAGGFLSEKYLGVDPRSVELNTYSKSKYASVIQQSGGWAWFQQLLGALQGIGQKHGASITNVAARWVLDKPVVPAIIIGARNAAHVADHAALMQLQLDDEDRALIQGVLDEGKPPRQDVYSWERGGEF